MTEVIGVILVCTLINTVELISVIFFGVGISILGAIDNISQNKIPINKLVLLTLQVLSTIFVSLSLLNEAPTFNVFFILIGMSIFYVLYNLKNIMSLKNANKISAIILLVVACVFVDIAFYNVLNIFRFIVFAICILGYLALIYIKKPCSKYLS